MPIFFAVAHPQTNRERRIIPEMVLGFIGGIYELLPRELVLALVFAVVAVLAEVLPLELLDDELEPKYAFKVCVSVWMLLIAVSIASYSVVIDA